MIRAVAPLLLVLLSACGGAKSGATPAAVAREPDPLIVATLNGPVMTDTALGYMANIDAVRPPDMPLSAPIPPIDVVPAGPVTDGTPLPDPGDCPACAVARSALTLDALAERLGGAPARGCVAALRYSAIWATRLPVDLPLPASARVIEAAGGDAPGCRMRAVAYGAAVPLARFLAAEHARATRAGYAVSYGANDDLHALNGRDANGGFVLVARDAGDGTTEVRLVTMGG